MVETYNREDTDIFVSIGHENLGGNVHGYAREVTNDKGVKGVVIFIPTKVGKSLLEIIKVKL